MQDQGNPTWHHIWLCLSVCLYFGVGALPALAEPDKSEWLLIQNHCDRGQISTYISRDAVRVVSQRWGYQVMAKAPTWAVYCFRPKEKVVWIGAMDQFSGHAMIDPATTPSKNSLSLRPAGNGILNGLKYTRYGLPSPSKELEYGSDQIKVQPKAIDFLCRYYDLPDVGKVPLFRCNDHGPGRTTTMDGKGQWLGGDIGADLRGGAIVELITKSGKQIPYNAKDFELPVGYKRMPNLISVSYSSKQKDTLTDVLDSVGFTAPESNSASQAKSAPAAKLKGAQ